MLDFVRMRIQIAHTMNERSFIKFSIFDPVKNADAFQYHHLIGDVL